MKLRSVLPMRIAKYGSIIISIIFCIVGILMILLPAPSIHALGVFFGISTILFGMVKLVGYYSKDLYRLAFQYDFQFGILLLILGCITLFRTDNMLIFICISLGICILADCLFKAKIAIEARHFGIRKWWLTAILSIAAGLAGLLLILRPFKVAQALIVLLGVAFLAEGILNLSVMFSLVKIIKNQKPDVIDVEYYE